MALTPLTNVARANDKYRTQLRATWIADPPDTSLLVRAVPANVPTIVTVGYGTDLETVFRVEGKSGDSSSNYALTGVTRLKGANQNLPENTAVNCLNHEEFFNQYEEKINEMIAALNTSGNLIINSGFTVNQRGYVSNAVLAAGAYGHDRWKAGASGGDYTFTQLNAPTQIKIKSGKSLIQVVENINVEGGDYTLSWEGTAQARFGKNSATPSGSYAASPITVTGQAAGTVMSVEFNEGTLGKVVLTKGTNPAQYYYRRFDEELRACKRYYEKSYPYSVAPGNAFETVEKNIGSSKNPLFYYGQGTANTNRKHAYQRFQVEKRAIPAITYYDLAGTASRVTSIDANGALVSDGITETYQAGGGDTNGVYVQTAANLVGFIAHWTAKSEL